MVFSLGTCSSMGIIFFIMISYHVIESAPDGGHSGLQWMHVNQELVKRGDRQYCGSRLFDAIRTACQGNYAALTRRSDPALLNSGVGYYDDETERNWLEKVPSNDFLGGRSHDFDMENWGFGSEASNSNGIGPFENSLMTGEGLESHGWILPSSQRNPKSLALRILTDAASSNSHHRTRRNVVDDCCKNPCGFRTMLKYCAPQ